MPIGNTVFKKVFNEISGKAEIIIKIINRVQIRCTQRTAEILLNDEDQLCAVI